MPSLVDPAGNSPIYRREPWKLEILSLSKPDALGKRTSKKFDFVGSQTIRKIQDETNTRSFRRALPMLQMTWIKRILLILHIFVLARPNSSATFLILMDGKGWNFEPSFICSPFQSALCLPTFCQRIPEGLFSCVLGYFSTALKY